jgi:hypothetical protein
MTIDNPILSSSHWTEPHVSPEQRRAECEGAAYRRALKRMGNRLVRAGDFKDLDKRLAKRRGGK